MSQIVRNQNQNPLMALKVQIDVTEHFVLQNGSQKPQKVKVDKRDLPENNAFHCEVCDWGFKTEEKFQEHVNEHEHVSWQLWLSPFRAQCRWLESAGQDMVVIGNRVILFHND